MEKSKGIVTPGLDTMRGGKKCHLFYVTLTTKKAYHYYSIIAVLSGLLHKRNCFRDYCLYPEFSKNCMLHFHGHVYTSNKQEFYKFISTWQRRVGYTKIDKIETSPDLIKTHLYSKKDLWLYRIRIHRHNHEILKQWALEQYLKVPPDRDWETNVF